MGDQLAAIALAALEHMRMRAHHEIGTGVDLFLWYWPQKEMKVGPFFSVFFPGDGLEDVLGTDDTGYAFGLYFAADI